MYKNICIAGAESYFHAIFKQMSVFGKGSKRLDWWKQVWRFEKKELFEYMDCLKSAFECLEFMRKHTFECEHIGSSF